MEKSWIEVRITAKAGEKMFLSHPSDLGLVCPKGNSVVSQNEASPEELLIKNCRSEQSRSHTGRRACGKTRSQASCKDSHCPTQLRLPIHRMVRQRSWWNESTP